MTLVHPHDLGPWLEWQAGRRRLRHLKGQLVDSVRPPNARWFVASNDRAPRVVVALDTASPTAVGSLVAPLRHLGSLPVAVVAPFELDAVVAGLDLEVRPLSPGLVDRLVDEAGCVVLAGQYLGVGAAASAAAQRYGRPVVMVQHGALTPYAPPLPPECTVLVWSDADGDFWRSGRDDVQLETVGSQLLWDAAQTHARADESGDGRLTYLGQGHAAELPRRQLVDAAWRFCRTHGATYRPHPSEHDKVSRLTLAGYRRAGVTVDASAPLHRLGGAVVSVFSTGVLEAAAQGRDAWVDFPHAPVWLEEFWDRYAMSRYGRAPTPAPSRPLTEPAQRIAELLRERAA